MQTLEIEISKLGEGAPLVPIFHKAIFFKTAKNIIVINIGGISNFTFLIGKTELIASDIGPGNTIDKFCLMRFNKYFDKNGSIASKGKVDYSLVNSWMKKLF